VLRLSLQGLGGHRYPLRVRSSRAPQHQDGVTVTPAGAGVWEVSVGFEGAQDQYVARELSLGLQTR